MGLILLKCVITHFFAFICLLIGIVTPLERRYYAHFVLHYNAFLMHCCAFCGVTTPFHIFVYHEPIGSRIKQYMALIQNHYFGAIDNFALSTIRTAALNITEALQTYQKSLHRTFYTTRTNF